MKRIFIGALFLSLMSSYFYFVSEPTVDLSAEEKIDPTNRIWLDKLPDSEKDMISVLALINEENLAVFQTTSAYSGSFDLATYQHKDGELTGTLLQSGKKYKITYTATTCKVDGWQFCMDVKGAPRGPKRYYSHRDFELDSHDQVAHNNGHITEFTFNHLKKYFNLIQ